MSRRERVPFDWDWRFHLGDHAGAEQMSVQDQDWRQLHVPHDWSIEGDFLESHTTGGDGGYVQSGIGWYRKTFEVPDGWRERKVKIQFDGVYMNSDVWINEVYLGNHSFGYGEFEYDLTPHLKFDAENVIAIRVDNSAQPNSRWFTGSGIYRHVWLLALDPIHVDRWGVYVTTPEITDQYALVQVETKVSLVQREGLRFTLNTEVLSPEGLSVASVKSELASVGDQVITRVQQTRVADPKLWSVDNPHMYTLRTTIEYNGVILDEVLTSFGIRSAVFDKDRGFLLNGAQVKINGVCVHHDGGSVGAAVPERVWERRLTILKEMGCNGIRMSHNPPTNELLDLCDRMGFLVMDESFDEWRITKNKNSSADVHGYYEYFDECAVRDLLMMVRRDRNHPSIVIWSVGNEIPEQRVENGYLVARRLVGICHAEDPTRLVTVACDNIEAEPIPAYESFLNELDVVGYNYVARWRMRTETLYGDDRHRYPNRRFIGSENPGIVAVRGEYPLEVSGEWWVGPYPTSMIGAEQLWKFTRAHDYVAGDFMWTGIDYIGETKWPNKNASFGVIDTCGFPKDGYYFYQSQWTKKPMAHLFPHWNWQGCEGQVIPVLCYTNCDMAELFVNGKSFGVKSYEFPRQGMSQEWAHFDKKMIHVTTSDLHLSWDVPYEPGELKVVGYSRDGAVLVESVVETTGAPAAIEVLPDRSEIAADGRDVSHLTVRVVDELGRVVPEADNELTFRLEGEGTLIGVDSGKPDSHESYKSNRRMTFHGLALAIVQSTRQPGMIRVIVEAEGMSAVELCMKTQAN